MQLEISIEQSCPHMNVVLMWLFFLSDIIVLATLTAIDSERMMCAVNVVKL